MELSEETKKNLIETAIQARRWAYAPYSHYSVGAALLTASIRRLPHDVFPLSSWPCEFFRVSNRPARCISATISG